MDNLTISIFKNQTFSEVAKELKSFSKSKIEFYTELSLLLKENKNYNQIIVLFLDETNEEELKKIVGYNLPLIIITKTKKLKNKLKNNFVEKINIPFKVSDLEKKIISLLAKYKFNKNSLINLSGYIIDKNQRKIKKNDLELQLTERETDFLILFSKTSKPINRNIVLQDVWKYSTESDTHTVETHIHRLRKKIFEKFGDKNFIKNNNKGYYI